MVATVPFHIKLVIISIVTFFLIILPEAMNWKMVALANEKSLPILDAMQSYEFQISLVVSLSVSAPMFFELLLWTLLYGKLDYVLPNFLTLISLAIPDLLILSYVRISADFISLNLIIQARFILFSWLAFTFIKKYGGNNWSSRGLLALFILICAGRVLGVYKGYVTNEVYDVLDDLGILSDCTVCLFFPLMSFQWYYYLFKKTRIVAISTDHYMCNIYVTAYFLTCFGVCMILYTSPNTLDLIKWNANELISHTLMFTVFYIIVIVFEGRVLQREMLQAKV